MPRRDGLEPGTVLIVFEANGGRGEQLIPTDPDLASMWMKRLVKYVPRDAIWYAIPYQPKDKNDRRST